MTYETGFGETWQGLLADGSLDMETVVKKYLEHYGFEPNVDPHTAIVDMITITRRQHWSKGPRKTQCAKASRLRVCRPSSDFAWQRPVCENYVLSANNEKLCPVMEELVDANVEKNRYMILTLSNCRDLEECSCAVLDELGFAERPKGSYNNYEKFSKAARQLIEKSISCFEVPCLMLLEYLQDQGFSGDHQSYARGPSSCLSNTW